MHRERGAKVFTIIGAVLLVLGVVLVALPTVARGGEEKGSQTSKYIV